MPASLNKDSLKELGLAEQDSIALCELWSVCLRYLEADADERAWNGLTDLMLYSRRAVYAAGSDTPARNLELLETMRNKEKQRIPAVGAG